jgi:hypothetical protein
LSPLSSAGGQKKKFGELISEIEVTGSSFTRRRLGSEPGVDCDPQYPPNGTSVNLTNNDILLELTSLQSCGLRNSCSGSKTFRLLPDRMDVILSSISDTSWLSSIQDDFRTRESDEILSKRHDRDPSGTQSALSRKGEEKLVSTPEPSSMAIESCLTVASVGGLSIDVIGKAVDMSVGEIEVVKPSKIRTQVTFSCDDAKAPVIVQAAEIVDEAYRQLLIGCRAHRATMLRMTSSVGTGALAPKSVQQLCQSGCSLLIRIGSITGYLTGHIEESEHQPLSQSLPHSQLSQVPTGGTGGQMECSLDAVIKQTHALMALSLHCAPDDVIAAVSDMLLTKITAQNNQSVWQQADRIQPVTAALFLAGILLLRVRILGAHASRLLLRAVEASVKRVPALAIGFLLPSMIGPRSGSHAGLCQQFGLYQHEMLQRVARQVLSEAQCDELLYHLSLGLTFNISRPDDSLPPTMRATCSVVDALLCSALSDYSRAANAPTGKGPSNKKKQGQGNSSSRSSTDRSSAMELNAVEQDACLLKWTNTASLSNTLPYGGELVSVWCAQIGLNFPDAPSLELVSALLATVNSILTKVRIERFATATVTLDIMKLNCKVLLVVLISIFCLTFFCPTSFVITKFCLFIFPIPLLPYRMLSLR